MERLYVSGDIPSFYWPKFISIDMQKLVEARHQDELHEALAEMANELGCTRSEADGGEGQG